MEQICVSGLDIYKVSKGPKLDLHRKTVKKIAKATLKCFEKNKSKGNYKILS